MTGRKSFMKENGTLRQPGDLSWMPGGKYWLLTGQSVQFLYENERLKEKPTIQIIDGYAHISARPKGEYQGDVLMAAWVVQAGVFCLSRNYPNDVLLTPMEVSDQ